MFTDEDESFEHEEDSQLLDTELKGIAKKRHNDSTMGTLTGDSNLLGD